MPLVLFPPATRSHPVECFSFFFTPSIPPPAGYLALGEDFDGDQDLQDVFVDCDLVAERVVDRKKIDGVATRVDLDPNLGPPPRRGGGCTPNLSLVSPARTPGLKKKPARWGGGIDTSSPSFSAPVPLVKNGAVPVLHFSKVDESFEPLICVLPTLGWWAWAQSYDPGFN